MPTRLHGVISQKAVVLEFTLEAYQQDDQCEIHGYRMAVEKLQGIWKCQVFWDVRLCHLVKCLPVCTASYPRRF